MVATSFLSGIFGMAGGLILIGVLLALLPLPTAMVLHAVTQIASNGWRGLLWRKHVRWGPVGAYVVRLRPGARRLVVLPLRAEHAGSAHFPGGDPVPGQAVPVRASSPTPKAALQGTVYGTVCMTLMLLTGVAGPLIDSFFLGGKLDRREIVATKAMCQIISHSSEARLFRRHHRAGRHARSGARRCSPSCRRWSERRAAKRFLEMMSDRQYRVWANRIIATIAGYYVIHGTTLLIISETSAK